MKLTEEKNPCQSGGGYYLHIPMHIYSDVYPIVFNKVYSQEFVYRIAT